MCVQGEYGMARWQTVKVYKLDDIFKLVTDLQARINDKHEEEPDR